MLQLLSDATDAEWTGFTECSRWKSIRLARIFIILANPVNPVETDSTGEDFHNPGKSC
jgi:hypothetical protein